MSPGFKGVVSEAAGWAVGIGLIAFAFIHQDELQGAVGALLGLDGQQQAAAQQNSGRGATGRVKADERPSRKGGTVELLAGQNGHFHTTAEINGRSIEVLVDTGASMVALPFEDAERAGIYVKDSDFNGRVSTANGTGRVATVTLDKVSIGDITVRNVKAAVAEPGRLNTTLLGMTFLGRLQRAEMRQGVLILQE